MQNIGYRLCVIFAAIATVGEAVAIDSGSISADSQLQRRDSENITLKAPVVGVPSQEWEGVDGTWSTFAIRVGTPEQYIRVLPATSWQETWVLLSNAVDVCNTTAGVLSNCQDDRGGVFKNQSSTWEQIEPASGYALGFNELLGYNGGGIYGYDTVGLGFSNSSSGVGGPTLTHQVVAQIVSQTFWLGIFGMGFQPTNFTGYSDPQSSFADTLYSDGTISSRSWGYTAGAYYRLKSVFGQMIFGGYDASRSIPNDVVFSMTGDNVRDIVVTIRSITSSTSSGDTELMSTPEFAFIDSAVPEIWLPVQACRAFEEAFGITLDPDSQYYLLDDSTYAALKSLNPNITFTLANQKTGGNTVDITLPYLAFDLEVSAPLLPNRTSKYFPLRQASNDSLYTLGRTFLQEAYVTTHYNSRTFNVSQCVFSDDTSAEILALPAVLPSSPSSPGSPEADPSSSQGTKLSGGAIAGIVIGALVALALLGLIVFLCLRRRKRTRAPSPSPIEAEGLRDEKFIKSGTAYEQQTNAIVNEVDGKDSKFEIGGNPIMHPQELEAEVPGAGTGTLEPTADQPGKTPMAELSAEEGGLAGVAMGKGVGEDKDERHVAGTGGDDRSSEGYVSPASEGGSRFGSGRRVSRNTGGGSGSGSANYSPTVSEPTRTLPSPVQRQLVGSRFDEKLDNN